MINRQQLAASSYQGYSPTRENMFEEPVSIRLGKKDSPFTHCKIFACKTEYSCGYMECPRSDGWSTDACGFGDSWENTCNDPQILKKSYVRKRKWTIGDL